jgi:hypothetical protein
MTAAPAPPVILWHDTEDPQRHLVEVRAADRAGLLAALTAVIEQSLRATLAHRHSTAPRKVIRLKTAGVGGTLAGVDLDDSASLLDRMDS